VAVVDQLRELERMGREEQLSGAASIVGRISSEFDRIKLFINESFEPQHA